MSGKGKQRQKADLGLAGAGSSFDCKQARGYFWGDENILKLDCNDCTTISVIKITEFTVIMDEFCGM